MKKNALLLILCFSTSIHVFTQILPNLNLTPTQWKTNGNIIDETFFMGTKNEFPLKFKTNDIERFRISTTGLIGIGTTNPQANLDVNGNVIFRTGVTLPNIPISTSPLQKKVLTIGADGTVSATPLFDIIQTGYEDDACLPESQDVLHPTWKNGTNKIYTYCPQTNVGIGTSTPAYKLDVVGVAYSDKILVGSRSSSAITANIHINSPYGGSTNRVLLLVENHDRKVFQVNNNGLVRAREIKVDLETSWPDYVFDTKYNLMPLIDLKTYLDQNKHLPHVPDAKTIETEGLSLGEMSKLSMEKIEELTLYLLQQQELLNKQSKLLEEQTQKIKALEELIHSKN